MGMTNIHQSSGVFSLAGADVIVQATIADHGGSVLLNGRNFDQTELDDLTDWIRDRRGDTWLARDRQRLLSPGPPPYPLPIPTVHTHPGLSRERLLPASPDIEAPQDDLSKFAFLLVIRGRNAAELTKVRVVYSLFAASAVAIEGSSTGYSVVFSAALLRRDVAKLTEYGLDLEKVNSRTELDAPGSRRVVRLIR